MNEGIGLSRVLKFGHAAVGYTGGMLRLATSLLALCLAGCAAAQAGRPAERPLRAVPLLPLPGAFDRVPVVMSNSPEIVTEPGVLVSTLPPARSGAGLDYPLTGRFELYSHHIAKDPAPDARRLCLGVLATNLDPEAGTSLLLEEGATALSQPEAPFVPLPTVTANPQGRIYAGPGDRVATALLAGTATDGPRRFALAPNQTRLLATLEIPTDVAIGPPINGRNTLWRFDTPGRVALSEVALFASPAEGGGWKPPSEAAFGVALLEGRLAGAREQAPTPLPPDGAAPRGAFRFGRAAGVALGAAWKGTLRAPDAARPVVGYPLAATRTRRLAVGPEQAPALARRYGDTAFAAHGAYGVAYELTLPLPGGATYALALTSPLEAPDPGHVRYLDPPGPAVTFRGSVGLTFPPESGRSPLLAHVVLKAGEEAPPFATVTVPPGRTETARVRLVYPADATPPQLLTISRR